MNVKLTDSNDRTRNGTQWGEGVIHRASGKGDLCTKGWIHYYRDPVLAVMMDPAHGNFGENAHMWTVTTSGKRKHEPDKSGAQCVRTVEQIEMPTVTLVQRQAFGILAAQEVYCQWAEYDRDGEWWNWSEAWLKGEDRNMAAARESAARAWVAAWANPKINLVEISHRALKY